ncbi:MAG: hypothetical protein CBC09_07515 [Cellvibrionales bacterium TMED49]|nr:hypothetical protein [Porticoccaceae bacterium]OUU37086.1 MAG: hypothetical protein CBC09_07515 [Cellvibrionales bacterium TMED49]|tara:strand:- start:664 stop:1506 length:843 start_codon:yes stop_codon:yes gene_type:complete
MVSHKALKITIISYLLTSCELTGSLFYESIDEYLGDYLKEFTNFSEQQKSQIDNFTSDYKEFLAKKELIKIRAILVELKGINHGNVETLVVSTESNFRAFLKTTNRYFEQHFVALSKTLTDPQILQIKDYLTFTKDKNLNDIEEKNFSTKVLDRYRNGFKRVGIILDKNQIEMISKSSHGLHELASEWRGFQNNWTSDLTELLFRKNEPNFEIALILHLRRQNEIGDTDFRKRVEENRLIINGIVVKIFSSLSPDQRRKFFQKLDFFISVIDRVIARRGG